MIQCAYHKREAERREVISHNRAVRMARPPKPTVVVPEQLLHPMVRQAFNANDDYLGTIHADQDLPEGTVRVVTVKAIHCGCRR